MPAAAPTPVTPPVNPATPVAANPAAPPANPAALAVPADPNKVTAATIVARLADLFKAIHALFTDKAIADVITLIKKVGIQGAVTTGCNALQTGLQGFRDFLETIKEPLDQTEALAGLIGLMQPLLRGVGRLVTASIDELRGLGLGELDKAIGPAKTVISIGNKVVGAGRDVIAGLPRAKDITDLQTSLTGVVTALTQFKAELAKPLPPPPPRNQPGQPGRPALPGGVL